MGIAAQIIRSYRSFSRRHAYKTKFEVSEKSDTRNESRTIDNRRASISTKSNTSPKAKNNGTKSQLSTNTSQLPEKVISVKPIDGRQMLESIQETKESEQM